ncbi:MAG: hypothetical protein J6B98_01110 [Bacilli bacterium]|nr:hypothetical protein [Bacilli bacterium]
MTFVREQEIKIENKDVYIIEVLTYEDDQYIYVQEIENDELVDKYMVYKYDQERNAMIHIKDEKKLEELLKMFVEKIQADI